MCEQRTAHALVIPALVEDTGDALYPFFHFSIFVVGREARRRFREAVLAHGEAWGCSGLHGLHTYMHTPSLGQGQREATFFTHTERGREGIFFSAEFTHDFVCDELVGEQLDWRVVVTCRD